MTVFSLFTKGGIFMWVLLGISIIVLAIVLEKYKILSKTRKLNAKLIKALKSQDKLDSLKSVLRIYNNESPLCVILSKMYLDSYKDDSLMKESVESTANLEMHKLEKGMGWLSTFAAIAPLIGFLGTVTGMVRVFMTIQSQSQQGIDVSSLAGGIWEALLTTVGGLIVGIIALICYNDLVQNLENIAKEMQDNTITHMINLKQLS